MDEKTPKIMNQRTAKFLRRIAKSSRMDYKMLKAIWKTTPWNMRNILRLGFEKATKTKNDDGEQT